MGLLVYPLSRLFFSIKKIVEIKNLAIFEGQWNLNEGGKIGGT